MKTLTFKGDRPKKRKRTEALTNDSSFPNSHAPTGELVVTSDQLRPEAEDEAPTDDTWVGADLATDISGPIIFVLPTLTPSCLASDAHGKVFCSAIENMVEDDPVTAEPHDVRQVWVASRVAGTQTLSFKGQHGSYLSCDKNGVMSALREAVGPEESWNVVPVPDHKGTFAVQNVRENFLSIGLESEKEGKDIELTRLRGDADTIGFAETVRVKMQARFKPRLKKDKEEKANSKISRKELEGAVGRRLEDDEIKKLKRARKEGSYHEALLDVKVKGKHDKFA